MKRLWTYLCYCLWRYVGGASDTYLAGKVMRLERENRTLRTNELELRAEVGVAQHELKLTVNALERFRTQMEKDIAINVREAEQAPARQPRRG